MLYLVSLAVLVSATILIVGLWGVRRGEPAGDATEAPDSFRPRSSFPLPKPPPLDATSLAVGGAESNRRFMREWGPRLRNHT